METILNTILEDIATGKLAERRLNEVRAFYDRERNEALNQICRLYDSSRRRLCVHPDLKFCTVDDYESIHHNESCYCVEYKHALKQFRIFVNPNKGNTVWITLPDDVEKANDLINANLSILADGDNELLAKLKSRVVEQVIRLYEAEEAWNRILDKYSEKNFESYVEGFLGD